MVQDWTGVIGNSLQSLWIALVDSLPNIIGAIAIFIIGLIVAAGIAKLVEKIFELLKIDTLLDRAGLTPHVERAGMKLRVARFLGRLVYWFLLIAFLLAAVNALGLTVFADFLRQALGYLGHVVIAILIMVAALVLANFVRGLVSASVASARLGASGFLGALAWWAVALFGFFAALLELGIAASIINALVFGLIAMLALAGGLAFGLGGRGVAEEVLRDFRERLKK